MRIGIDISQAVYGTGVSDYVVDLVNHLPSDMLSLVGFSLRRQSDLKKLFPTSLTYSIPPSILNVMWNKLHVVDFGNFVSGHIDIYHSSDWAQAPSTSKKVTTVHDLSPFLYPQETSSAIVSTHTSRMRWVISECDKIICVSKSTEVDLHRTFPSTKGKTVVIHEAMPLRFAITPQSVDSKPYIVAIGARQPRKNIARLISSYQKYKSKYHLPDQLVVIGEKPNGFSLPQSDNVMFTGYVSDQDLVNYLANSQAFVYPSLHEGFGLPILIAFYHHVPIACSDISVFREVAGDSADFFNPLDEESIARSISMSIKNKKRLINSGERTLQKYTWPKVAQSTLEVYTALCS